MFQHTKWIHLEISLSWIQCPSNNRASASFPFLVNIFFFFSVSFVGNCECMGNCPNLVFSLQGQWKCTPPLFEETYQILLSTDPPGGLASWCETCNLNTPGWSPLWNVFAQEEKKNCVPDRKNNLYFTMFRRRCWCGIYVPYLRTTQGYESGLR